MGKGLSLDEKTYFSEFLQSNSDKKPPWMDFALKISKYAGRYEIVDYLSGYSNLTQFLFRTPKYPIGGMLFDGIIRTEHISSIRTTQYPVQTGVQMTDHSVIEPAELQIEVMLTDASTSTYVSDNVVLNMLYQASKTYKSIYSCFSGLSSPSPILQVGNGRGITGWQRLRYMQLARQPITVETRLQRYDNMIIEELSTPDDVRTSNALRCSIRLRQIIFADVAEVETSVRAATTQETSGGGVAVTAQVPEETALKAIINTVQGG